MTNRWSIGTSTVYLANASLGRVRSDFEAFLTKWSASISDGRKRERFLYNNYSLVSTVLSVIPVLFSTDVERGWQSSRTRKTAFQQSGQGV
jgi:vacuolar protein sorting-associated protein 52